MTFFEFMKQQTKRDDIIGDLAGDMSIDAKLFPSEDLADYDVSQWRKRLKSKTWDSAVIESFETAVKEFELVE